MTSISTDELASVGLAALEKSSDLLTHRFQQPTSVNRKAGHEITIPEDRQTEELIIKTIQNAFPNHQIVSEEIGTIPTNSPYCWYIDPLEGTTNYSQGIPFFATQLAVSCNSELLFSAIKLPILGDLYQASKGGGAFLNDRQMYIDDDQPLSASTISVGKGSTDADFRWWSNTISRLATKTRSLRLFGATGVELGYVASGKLAAHLNSGSKIVDYAAGVLIVREAGGVAQTVEGNDWKLGDKTLVAGGAHLVSAIKATGSFS